MREETTFDSLLNNKLKNIAVKGFGIKDDNAIRVNDLPGATEAEKPTAVALNFKNQN